MRYVWNKRRSENTAPRVQIQHEVEVGNRSGAGGAQDYDILPESRSNTKLGIISKKRLVLIFELPDNRVLGVADDNVASQTPGVGSDFLSYLLPPGVAGIAILFVEAVQELDGAATHQTA